MRITDKTSVVSYPADSGMRLFVYKDKEASEPSVSLHFHGDFAVAMTYLDGLGLYVQLSDADCRRILDAVIAPIFPSR